MKRTLIGLALIALLVTIASVEDYRGPLTAVDPDVAATIQDSLDWFSRPPIMWRMGDPDGVYVVMPGMPNGNEFGFVRVSAATGAQQRLRAEVGPHSPFRDCLPVDAIRAVVRGVRFKRLAIHPFMLPGGGPGFHRTDSATGRIDIVFDAGDGRVRRLLTQRAYNSDRIVELLASVNVDRDRHWIATTVRKPQAWEVFVFRLPAR